MFSQLLKLCLLLSPWGFPNGSDGEESANKAGDLGLIPESERSPGEGNGNPLQYSCLENSMDRGYSPWDRRVGHDWVTNTFTFKPFFNLFYSTSLLFAIEPLACSILRSLKPVHYLGRSQWSKICWYLKYLDKIFFILFALKSCGKTDKLSWSSDLFQYSGLIMHFPVCKETTSYCTI